MCVRSGNRLDKGKKKKEEEIKRYSRFGKKMQKIIRKNHA